MTQPVDVVAAWFDAWDRGDVDSARAYIAPEAPTFVSGALVARGPDDFREWYAARRERLGESFA